MKISASYIDLECADGVWRTIRRCSTAKQFDLSERLTALGTYKKKLNQNLSISALYSEDSHFRYICDEILRLCGVDPEWVSIPMMTEMIFSSEKYPFGLLVEFNFGYGESAKKQGKDGINNLGSMIGALWKNTGSLKDTMVLLEDLPHDVVKDLLESQRPQKKKWQEKAAKDYERLGQRGGKGPVPIRGGGTNAS